MASGKKNYFRHSFFTRNDIKMLMLKDRVGIGFYFYFFSLLEICGEESSDQLQDKYTFHDSTIRSLWGVNLKKSEHIAHQMNAVGLLEFKKGEKNFQFTIPKFAKYMGRYQTKKEPNTSNKRKGKERKEKERKVNCENALTPDDIVQLWNEMMPPTFEYCRGLGSGGHIINLKATLTEIKTKEEWRELFTLVKKSDQLSAKTDIKFLASLTWVIQQDKAIKIRNGDYKNKKTGMSFEERVRLIEECNEE